MNLAQYKMHLIKKEQIKELMNEAIGIATKVYVEKLDVHTPDENGKISYARQATTDKTPQELIEMIDDNWSHISCVVRSLPSVYGEFGIRVDGGQDVDYFLFIEISEEDVYTLAEKYNLKKFE